MRWKGPTMLDHSHRFSGPWVEIDGEPAYRRCEYPGCTVGEISPDPDGDWTYEVTVRVQVQLTGVERDRRDGDDGAIRRAALADIEAHPPSITDTDVSGWWPTVQYQEVGPIRKATDVR
jgi:hypothetical protein